MTEMSNRRRHRVAINRARNALVAVEPIIEGLINAEYNIETWGLHGRLAALREANAAIAAYLASGAEGPQGDPPWERCSDARLRELWKAHGGGLRTKKGVGVEAFSEMHLLPALLKRIIEFACNAKEIA